MPSMPESDDFDDIRPYKDQQVNAKLRELTTKGSFFFYFTTTTAKTAGKASRAAVEASRATDGTTEETRRTNSNTDEGY